MYMHAPLQCMYMHAPLQYMYMHAPLCSVVVWGEGKGG